MKFKSKYSELTSTVGKYSFAPLPLKKRQSDVDQMTKKLNTFQCFQKALTADGKRWLLHSEKSATFPPILGN